MAAWSVVKVIVADVSAGVALMSVICGAWVFTAGYTSINAIVKSELFPTKVRATGVALPYAITVSIFGGTAPVIALWFKQAGHESWFYYYLAGMIGLSLLVYLTMRDTRHVSAMQEEVG